MNRVYWVWLTTFLAVSADVARLLVVALGGNALSPPSGESSYALEREIVDQTARELQTLIRANYRLLVVPGNGPQVGRLMRDDLTGENLDVYVSQTQGELGYLLVQALERLGISDSVSLVTRTVVAAEDVALLTPVKEVGPVVKLLPDVPSRAVRGGWRILVGSPQPIEVAEFTAIRSLLSHQHVIAGGGGGVPVTPCGQPVQGVVDKDRVAALLAVRLHAEALVFVTDVEGVFTNFGTSSQHLEHSLDCKRAERLVAQGAFGAGSMAPKVESAISYVRALKRTAYVANLGSISSAISTRQVPRWCRSLADQALFPFPLDSGIT